LKPTNAGVKPANHACLQGLGSMEKGAGRLRMPLIQLWAWDCLHNALAMAELLIENCPVREHVP
jgi:hypothetical protein